MKVECGTPDERKSAAIATSSPTSFGFASSAPLDPPTPSLTSASLSLGERFATHSSGRRHSSPQREVALPTRVHSLDLASSFIRSPPRPPTIRVDIVSVEPQSISFTAPDIGRRVHAHCRGQRHDSSHEALRWSSTAVSALSRRRPAAANGIAAPSSDERAVLDRFRRVASNQGVKSTGRSRSRSIRPGRRSRAKSTRGGGSGGGRRRRGREVRTRSVKAPSADPAALRTVRD